jgi:hypothetical protein
MVKYQINSQGFWEKVNPKSCYRAFVPTNFVKLNRYLFLHKKIIPSSFDDKMNDS